MSDPHVIESVTVRIGAPTEFVWNVLVDYPRYPEWNPYTVKVVTTLAVGDPIDLTLPSPDGSSGTFVNREHLRVVEPPRHLRYDTGDELPGIFAVRDQWIEPLGAALCSYRTTDAFSGQYAGKVIEVSGPWVKAGFDAVAHALKARAEQLWAGLGGRRLAVGATGPRHPAGRDTPGMAFLQLAAIIVDEYDPAIEFFVDALGFELVEDSPAVTTGSGQPKRWVVVRPPGAETGILLARAEGEEQAAAVGNQLSGRVGFLLQVDDFDAAYQRMSDAGVRFLEAPRSEPYGRVVVFLDIAGNRWDLLGPAA